MELLFTFLNFQERLGLPPESLGATFHFERFLNFQEPFPKVWEPLGAVPESLGAAFEFSEAAFDVPKNSGAALGAAYENSQAAFDVPKFSVASFEASTSSRC